MSACDVERILKRMGTKLITNATQKGTYAIVEANRFSTQGISNRDNARWKRAQFIIVEHCPVSYVNSCLRGFLLFAEYCQVLIIANTHQAFDGRGKSVELKELEKYKRQ